MKICLMVNISKLQDSYLRIKNYIVNTPILVSDDLNKQFNASFFSKMKLIKSLDHSKLEELYQL